ncbi:MAG: TIGR02453 family protein [Thermoplasmata archaeon]|nr:TIGR02453 family protein [Thermoplasmata archaeon]MCI4354056.1 TIGR02453 family protein [Thermoplasmata archaeon]
MPQSSSDGPYFGRESLRFLSDLARNNDREWFQKNKPRYESSIQTPALRFIRDKAPRLARLSPHVVADARPFGGSLSRIYRDTRFSKDKRPYKTGVGIHFSHEDAAKGEHLPGFYLHIEPGESIVASGIWRPEPPAAQRIRDAIVASPTHWAKVLPKGVALGGEAYVRVPSGYPADHRFASALRQKDFFASVPISDAEVAGSAFGRAFETACRRLDPLNRFLAKATGVRW